MRSTRATAALARLNFRSEGRHYQMVMTGAGLFKLRERIEGIALDLSADLSLDEFVSLADSMGPKKVPRITKNEAAFTKQLMKKDFSP